VEGEVGASIRSSEKRNKRAVKSAEQNAGEQRNPR